MRVEHSAFNVPEPEAMANWYIENMGMKLLWSGGGAWFISDEFDDGRFELYCRPDLTPPDYFSMPPFQLHLAFETKTLEADYQRLLDAGCTPEGPAPESPNGLVFLRDPWGITLQLACRETPFI